jgi:putative tricarboxylic transport membrane protein
MTDQTDPPQHAEEEPVMDRADLLTALVLFALGAAILWWSWTMPRLEMRRIHPLTVPGLVPGLLGGALMLCSAILGLRAWQRMRQGTREGWRALARLLSGDAARRVAVLSVLILTYTLVLIGLVPFWIATALFVFAAIAVFELVLTDQTRPLRAGLSWAAGQAFVVAVIVTLVFERGFLVRLP